MAMSDNLNAESVLEENTQKLNERNLHLNDCEKQIAEMSEKIHYLESTLLSMKVSLPAVLDYGISKFFKNSPSFLSFW